VRAVVTADAADSARRIRAFGATKQLNFLGKGHVMKAVLIASTIGFALATGSASAADLYPLKAPPPVYSWTGCYIDAGVGYGLWDQSHYTDATVAGVPTQLSPSTNTGGEGWLGRVGAGCDYQVGSRWVVGVFGDYDFTSLTGSFQDPWTGWIGNETEHNQWGIGGRIGYLLTPRVLGYFDGGYTQASFGQINLLTDSVPQVVPGACGTGPCFMPATTYSGWFLGGGYEYALADIIPLPGLYWRTEYRYAWYGTKDVPILTSAGAPLFIGTGACDVGSGCTGFNDPMRKDVQTITSGIVWKFNFGGSAPCCALVTKD
jgi:outer membrane immunogenic protein